MTLASAAAAWAFVFSGFRSHIPLYTLTTHIKTYTFPVTIPLSFRFPSNNYYKHITYI
jgi:hypothetical protein